MFFLTKSIVNSILTKELFLSEFVVNRNLMVSMLSINMFTLNYYYYYYNYYYLLLFIFILFFLMPSNLKLGKLTKN